MKLPFFSTTTSAAAAAGGGSSSKKMKSKKKTRSLSRSDPPSFCSATSSSSSTDQSTTPKTVLVLPHPLPLPPRPRAPCIGRNASCLDAEYSDVSIHRTPCTPALRRADTDKITRKELELVLRRLGGGGEGGGGREEHYAEVLAEADQDGDGLISLEELLRPEEVEEYRVEEELRVAFGVYDANGDGKISAEELWGVFRLIGDESCSLDDCRRMIGGVDSDGDGFVCFRDFARMMMATTNAQKCF